MSLAMRVPGWRSIRAHVERPHRSPAVPPAPRLPRVDEDALAGGVMPWMAVDWSLLLVGFLAYVFITTTYYISGGDYAMGAALFGLILVRGPLRRPPLIAWMLVYCWWCVMGLAMTDYPTVVIERLRDFLKLWLIVVVAVNALTTRAALRLFMVFFAGCFALFPLRGAFVNFLGGDTLFGRALWNHIFSNPNDLAAITLLQLSMVAGMLSSGVRGWIRACCLAGAFLLPLLILITQSRGAIIAMGVFAIALLVEQRRRLRPRVILRLLAAAALLAYVTPSSVWTRLGGVRRVTSTAQLDAVDPEGSARQRFEIWRVAARIIREHRVLGVGLGAYKLEHLRVSRSAEFNPTARGARDTHSTVLNVAAETGVVGLLLFLLLIGTAVRDAERVRRAGRTLLPAGARQLLYLELGLLAYFVAGVWGSYAHLAFTYLHVALIVSATAILRQELGLQTQGGGAVARSPARATRA